MKREEYTMNATETVKEKIESATILAKLIAEEPDKKERDIVIAMANAYVDGLLAGRMLNAVQMM